MKTVTIAEYTTMPGRFVVTGPARGQRRDTSDAGNAAAIAINYANLTAGPCVIVGAKKVMELIPEEVRIKR